MLKIVSKTTLSKELIGIMPRELEQLVEEKLIVEPIGYVPSIFTRSDRVKWYWLAQEADDLVSLYRMTMGYPGVDELKALRDKHTKIRDRLARVLSSHSAS